MTGFPLLLLQLTTLCLFLGGARAQPILNEWLANSGTADDWIEMYNPTTNNFPIDGLVLSDSSKTAKYVISGQTVPGLGYWTINQYNGGVPPYFGVTGSNPGGAGFGISSSGESLYFFDGAATLVVLDKVTFDGSALNQTYGQWTLSTGALKTAYLSRPTKGAANAYPYVGPVIFTEINYAPGSKPQYVAIKNRGSSPVNLYYDNGGTQIQWKVNGLGFTFPPNSVLAPGQTAYLCSLNYTAQEFQTAWSSKLSTVTPTPQVFCDWNGTLNINGETITIWSIDIDNGTVLQIPVDTVTYSNTTLGSDTSVNYLVRLSEASYGGEPANWVSSAVAAQTCSSPGDCLKIDNCTVATCSGGKCSYSLSTQPPICAAPQPAPAPPPGPSGTPPSPSGSAPAPTATTTTGTPSTTGSNPPPASTTSVSSQSAALFGLLFVAIFSLL